jgi:AAA family ATP:ADP antiporter
MCAHALLETARDALFLEMIPASQLPWVYLIIAVLAIGVMMTFRFGGESPRDRLIFAQVSAAVVTLGFWWIIGREEIWLYYALYVWSAMIASIIVVSFWLFLGELFTIAESKRLFASIGFGGALGALTGFGLASLTQRVREARQGSQNFRLHSVNGKTRT